MNTRVWAALVLAMAIICMPGCKKKDAVPDQSQAKSDTTQDTKEAPVMSVNQESFGQTSEGREVDLYTLTNSNGLKARITNYGAILVSLEVPDRAGKFADITLGFNTIDGYLGEHPYFGAVVGRYANRIGAARFVLDGVEYKLAANNDENHLHGGLKGFDKVVWKLEDLKSEGRSALVKLSYISEDGEEGYPGNLACSVTYTLTEDDELQISYEADTDKATVLNLTNHTYFNLAGQGTGDILGHELMLVADKYTVVDKGLIPTGENRNVKDSPMDFTVSASIGSRIEQTGMGYDHNYVLNSGGGSLALCARVYEPTTGRVMEVSTTQPGVQLYTGNFLDGSLTGKDGKKYEKHYAFCLETQHFPDSPNKPGFPSVVLNPGQKYATTTVFKFSARQ
ncbi:MAG: aldose epimerase family protein [Planctomycetota bacterium]|nr:aldose epimerase family protein [Planctomycetota bacterium]